MNTSQDIPEKTTCFQIWYEQEQQLLRLHWQAFASVHEVKESLLTVLERLKKELVHSLLLDLSGMPELSAFDQYWLEVEYLTAVPKLPLQRLALVLTSYAQHQAFLEAGIYRPSFDIQVFDDADTALEWLRQPAALELYAGTARLSADVAA